MEKLVVLEDTKVLLPNKEHKTFTESTEVLTKGTVVTGQPKYIQGLRRGEQFTYRLFEIGENKFIFLNKVKIENNMNKTTVTLGANGDSNASGPATLINLKPSQFFSKLKLICAAGGGLLGYAYAKHKKHDLKGSAKYIALGAAIGYAAAFVIDSKRAATVNAVKNKV